MGLETRRQTSLNEGYPPEEADLRQAISDLGSKNTVVSKNAIATLIRGGASAIELLLPVIEEEAKGYRKRRPWVKRIRSIAEIVAALLIPVVLCVGILTARRQAVSVMLIVTGIVILGLAKEIFVHRFQNLSRRHKNALVALGLIEEVRSIGPLLEAYTSCEKGARPMLLRLLPRLQASDRRMLTAQHYQALLHRLRPQRGYQDNELQIALLRALEQIGDAEAIPAVTHLVGSPDSAIRQAAEECLPTLRQRAERERTAQTLVRPSSLPASPSDVLVRPAGQNAGSEALLLRSPIETDEEAR